MNEPDPYAWSFDDCRFEVLLGFAISDPRSLVKVLPITWQRDLMFMDPALRWARSWRDFVRQLRDIIVHEFWTAAGQPFRSPAWVPVQAVVDEGRIR